MDERTITYLRGRFRDYYRRATLTPPPYPTQREWGYIPWSTDGETQMIRHQSLLDYGSVNEFLTETRPQHAYFSAARYRAPNAETMNNKGWIGTDLVFDLDADHLPTVDPNTDSYRSMLETCKTELMRLLTFLEDDFGFEDITIVFSGGRGYHAHVRDENSQPLDSQARRQIVDFVSGTQVGFDMVTEWREHQTSANSDQATDQLFITRDGGWGRRVNEYISRRTAEVVDMDRENAMAELTAYDNIGEKKAEAILDVMTEKQEVIERGAVDLRGAFKEFARKLVAEATDAKAVAIDEPVTTDTRRLIRIPGSLHGGTALKVTRVSRENLETFNPLVDAVPDLFREHEVRVEIVDGGDVEFDGDTHTLPEGETVLPEHFALFLMARGRARKLKESV